MYVQIMDIFAKQFLTYVICSYDSGFEGKLDVYKNIYGYK